MIDFVGNTNPGCGPVSDLNTEITPLEPTRNHRPPCGLAACILPIFHGSQVRDTMHTRVATSRYVFSLHQLKSIALMSTQPRFSLVPPRRLRRDSMPRDLNCLFIFPHCTMRAEASYHDFSVLKVLDIVVYSVNAYCLCTSRQTSLGLAPLSPVIRRAAFLGTRQWKELYARLDIFIPEDIRLYQTSVVCDGHTGCR